MPEIRITVSYEQLLAMKLAAHNRAERERHSRGTDILISPAQMIEEWLPRFMGPPCRECGVMTEVSREASFERPEDGKWVSAFQDNLILSRCFTAGCGEHGELHVFAAETWEPYDPNAEKNKPVVIQGVSA